MDHLGQMKDLIEENRGPCTSQGNAAASVTTERTTVSGSLGFSNLLAVAEAGEQGVEAMRGLVQVRATAASVVGLDPSLGEEPCPVLCVEAFAPDAAAMQATQRARMDVMLVIDTSGSMRGAVEQVREACSMVFSTLMPEDSIGVVGFSHEATELLQLTQKQDVFDFNSVCEQISASGGTDIEIGLRTGMGMLANSQPSASSSAPPALLILLSDGCPNRGARTSEELCCIMRQLSAASKRSTTLHSLGFTAGHDTRLMQSLPNSSCGVPGRYYYLSTLQDVSASIGDCLGASSARTPCLGLAASIEACDIRNAQPAGCYWYGPDASDSADSALLGLAVSAPRVDALYTAERQCFLFAMPRGATGASVSLAWCTEDGVQENFNIQICWAAAPPLDYIDLANHEAPKTLEGLLVLSQILRLRAAAALAALAIGGQDLGRRYEPLHGAVLRCLTALQSITTDAADAGDGGVTAEAEATFLEGMLQALERDLGEALAAPSTGSNERRGVLLSFAAEHFAMRSASSLTRCRTAYASREQIELRLRFLQSSVSGGAKAKAECVVDEPGLTHEELECRRSAEEQVCFVSLGNWRDEVLGLGLFVHPRTARERRSNLPPQVDLSIDYVSAQMYNLGVRATVHHNTEGDAQELDGHEDDLAADSLATVLQSSSRRRINGWLPLYINKDNWAVAKMFAPSAFSLIATQLNIDFQPRDALLVCAQLMNCIVVGFVRTNQDIDRAGASDRAIQMYCDVHRLLHQMALDYPQIRNIALADVQGFIRDPEKRNRKRTPNLGNLIVFLSILDEIAWTDLCHVFVPEMVRRVFGRIKEPFDSSFLYTEADLIARFDELEPEHGRVILFHKIFNLLVARPSTPWHEPTDSMQSASIDGQAVRQMYDRRWGQLPQARRCTVFQEIRRVRCLGSVATVLQELLPFDFGMVDTCDLLLWAEKYGRESTIISEWPQLQDSRKTFHAQWKREAEVRRAMLEDGMRMLSSGMPLLQFLLGLQHAETQQEESSSIVLSAQTPKFESREAACEAAAKARHRAETEAENKSRSSGNYSGMWPRQRSALSCVQMLRQALDEHLGFDPRGHLFLPECIDGVSVLVPQKELPSDHELNFFLVDDTQLKLQHRHVPDRLEYRESMDMKDVVAAKAVHFGDVVKGNLSGGWLQVKATRQERPLGMMRHVNCDSSDAVTRLRQPSGDFASGAVKPQEDVEVLEVRGRASRSILCRKEKCRRCGCSVERDAEGERVCWCNSCWDSGCDFGEVHKATEEVDIARVRCSAGEGWLSFRDLQVIPMTSERATISEGERETDLEEEGARLLKSAMRRQHFDLDVIVRGGLFDTENDDRHFTLSNLHFERNGQLTTGSYLRERISAEIGLPAGSLRLLLSGAQRAVPPKASTAAVTPICNSAVLAHWHLERKSTANGPQIEVVPKRRGGRKPGNGWFTAVNKRTCEMNIARTIAQETVFARAVQFRVNITDGRYLQFMLSLCDKLERDALVLCGGCLSMYRYLLNECGWSVDTDGHARKDGRSLFLLSEVDVAPDALIQADLASAWPTPTQWMPTLGAPALETKASESAGASDNTLNPVELHIPDDASTARLIFVLNGHLLRETASVAKAVWSVVAPGSTGLPVFHLTSNRVELFLESEALRTQLMGKLDGHASTPCLRESVDWPGLPHLPVGPALIGNFPKCVPAVVRFQMRTSSLGLVVRLRERYGCAVTELPYDISLQILDQANKFEG